MWNRGGVGGESFPGLCSNRCLTVSPASGKTLQLRPSVPMKQRTMPSCADQVRVAALLRGDPCLVFNHSPPSLGPPPFTSRWVAHVEIRPEFAYFDKVIRLCLDVCHISSFFFSSSFESGPLAPVESARVSVPFIL